MIQKFEYNTLPVRTTADEEGQIWFAGIDVCNILGYAMSSNVIKDNLDEDERKLTNLTDGSGQQRKTWVINEFGLYSLILSSSKPEAKDFKRWVTHEVLPCIRKAGKYTTEQERDRELTLMNMVADIQNIKLKKDEFQGKVNALKKEIELKTDEMIDFIKSDRTQLKIEFPA